MQWLMKWWMCFIYDNECVIQWSSYCIVDIPGFQRQLNEELVGLTIYYGKINIMKIEVSIVKVGLVLFFQW